MQKSLLRPRSARKLEGHLRVEIGVLPARAAEAREQGASAAFRDPEVVSQSRHQEGHFSCGQ